MTSAYRIGSEPAIMVIAGMAAVSPLDKEPTGEEKKT